MSKYTPGPWLISCIEDKPKELMIGAGDGSDVICDVRHRSGFQANARLIAAAPELLEALKLAEEHLLDDYGPEFTHPHAEIIRKAIEKAEGK